MTNAIGRNQHSSRWRTAALHASCGVIGRWRRYGTRRLARGQDDTHCGIMGLQLLCLLCHDRAAARIDFKYLPLLSLAMPAPTPMIESTNFLERVARGVLRLVLILAAAVFIISLLLATLIIMLVVTIWSVVTGRKPDPAKIFGRFRQTSARYTRGAWHGRTGPSGAHARPSADVVDVPAHEVRDIPSPPGSDKL